MYSMIGKQCFRIGDIKLSKKIKHYEVKKKRLRNTFTNENFF